MWLFCIMSAICGIRVVGHNCGINNLLTREIDWVFLKQVFEGLKYQGKSSKNCRYDEPESISQGAIKLEIQRN